MALAWETLFLHHVQGIRWSIMVFHRKYLGTGQKSTPADDSGAAEDDASTTDEAPEGVGAFRAGSTRDDAPAAGDSSAPPVPQYPAPVITPICASAETCSTSEMFTFSSVGVDQDLWVPYWRQPASHSISHSSPVSSA